MLCAPLKGPSAPALPCYLGLAAISTALLAVLKAGDHLLVT